MDNSYDLLKIYGIDNTYYNEEDPSKLFIKDLPSLEQIASFNQALRDPNFIVSNNEPSTINKPSPNLPMTLNDISTPATTITGRNNDIIDVLSDDNRNISEIVTSTKSNTLGNVNRSAITENDSITKQITDYSNPYPVTKESIQYLNGFMRTQIGRRAQFQFQIGSNELVSKDGYLLGVGANYILINEIGTNDITACDFYNIKFIRFLY